MVGPSEQSALSDAEVRAVDEFWNREASGLASAAEELSWPGGGARREVLAAAAEQARSTKGFLSKETFDEILKWGFGRASNLTETDVQAATKEAFARLAQGDEAGALRRLRELPGIGVSRATKILALSDQQNLGVYDSHAAAALSSIRKGDRPLIAVPPGQSKGLKGTSTASQERLTRDYPKYTAVLRRLLENAKRDQRYARTFKGVADLEQALFSSHRGPDTAETGEVRSRPIVAAGSTVRDSVGAALAGAAIGAVSDLPELHSGKLSWREARKRRLRDGFRSGTAGAAASVAKRFGKATSGPALHLQNGARAAVVGVIIGTVNDSGAVIRGELRPRAFVENRALDAGEAGISRMAGGVVVFGFAAAPFEAPVIVVGGSVLLVG